MGWRGRQVKYKIEEKRPRRTALIILALFSDLRSCGVEPSALESYLKIMSPVVPLIGDYLFRCIVPYRIAEGVPEVDEADKEESVRMHLAEKEIEELRQKQLNQLGLLR